MILLVKGRPLGAKRVRHHAGWEEAIFKSYIHDVIQIGLAKIVSCPSQNRFDQKTPMGPAGKLFQALTHVELLPG